MYHLYANSEFHDQLDVGFPAPEDKKGAKSESTATMRIPVEIFH